jgi:thiamine kinase-like enzyme
LFVNACGLLHFDAHLGNILTDDKRLYFADYDLAISSRFEQAVVAVHEQVTSLQTDKATAVSSLDV